MPSSGADWTFFQNRGGREKKKKKGVPAIKAHFSLYSYSCKEEKKGEGKVGRNVVGLRTNGPPEEVGGGGEENRLSGLFEEKGRKKKGEGGKGKPNVLLPRPVRFPVLSQGKKGWPPYDLHALSSCPAARSRPGKGGEKETSLSSFAFSLAGKEEGGRKNMSSFVFLLFSQAFAQGEGGGEGKEEEEALLLHERERFPFYSLSVSQKEKKGKKEKEGLIMKKTSLFACRG